jgi:hypothetical protein
MDSAFEYATKNELELQKKYPYTGKDDNCTFDGKGPVKITGFVDVKKNDLAALEEAVDLQPVSVAVNAGSLGW